MENNVLIKIQADTSGLHTAAEQLKALGQISDEQYQKFQKTAADNNKLMADLAQKQVQAANATEQTIGEMDKLDKSVKNVATTVQKGFASEGMEKATAQTAKLDEGLKKAGASAGAMGQNSKKGFTMFTQAVEQGAGGISVFGTSLTGLFDMILANPIGLLIAAVVMLLMAFKRLEPVANFLEGAFEGLGMAFDVLLDNIGKVARSILHLYQAVGFLLIGKFDEAKQHAMDFGNGMMEVGTAMGNAVKAGYDYIQMLDEWEDKQAAFNLEIAKSEALVTKLVIQSKNHSKSEQERIGLLDKASKEETKSIQAQIANAEEFVKIQKMKLDATAKNSKEWDEQNKKYLDAQTNVVRLQQSSDNLQEKIQNRRDALQQEFAQKEQARIQKIEEARKKALEEEQKRVAALKALELDLANQKAKATKDEIARLDLEEAAAIQAAQDKYKNVAGGERQLAELMFNINLEFENKRIDAAKQAEEQVKAIRDKAFKDYIADLEKQQRTEQQHQIAMLDLEAASADTSKERKREIEMQKAEIALESIHLQELNLKTSFEKGIVTEKEYQEKLQELRNQYAEKDTARENLATEQKRQRFKEELATFEQLSSKGFELTKQLIDNRLQSELNGYESEIQANKDLLDKKLINEDEFNRRKAEIEKKEKEAKRKAAEDEKKLKMFQISINTAAAIAKTIAEVPKFDFGITTGILVALYAAMGAAQLAAVAGQPIPQFATGIEYLDGPGTETSDSIVAKLSRGEAVLSAKMNRDYRPAVSAIFNRKVSPELMNEFALDPDKFLSARIDRMPVLNEAVMNKAIEMMLRGTGVSLDYERMGKSIADHIAPEIKSMPQSSLRIDSEGFKSWVKVGNASIEEDFHKRSVIK